MNIDSPYNTYLRKEGLRRVAARKIIGGTRHRGRPQVNIELKVKNDMDILGLKPKDVQSRNNLKNLIWAANPRKG